MAITAEQVLESLQTLRGEYEELEGAEIPNTLKEAVENRWELVAAAIQIIGVTEYPVDQQEKDSRRALPLGRALALIRELEEEIIRDCVIKPTEIAEKAFWSNVTGIYGVIWKTVKAIWDAWAQITEGWGFVKAVLSALLFSLVDSAKLIALPELAKAFNKAMKKKEQAAMRLEKLVLPQRVGKRYRVRKESRR